MNRPTALLAAILLAPPAFGQEVIKYYHLDAIGSVRVVTNAAGAVVERHDYLPFGEECLTGPCASNPGVGAGQPRKFTGKERDAETGLDYFGARYYGSKIGRFTTVDPVYTWRENLVDPQRWNRYAYGRNNPFRYVDPDGKVIFDYAEFKQNVSLIGAPGVGADIRALAVLATAGSIANDVLLVVGVGEVLQGIRGGLAATSVARTGLGLLDDAGQAGARAARGGAAAGRTAIEGIYEFPDQCAGCAPYVGQSGSIPNRLAQHEAAGRLVRGTENTTEVLGGKTAREIAEHRRIRQITGDVPARQSPAVSNKVDPIGPARQHLLKDQ
jgi:RHS repeat-associated protein